MVDAVKLGASLYRATSCLGVYAHCAPKGNRIERLFKSLSAVIRREKRGTLAGVKSSTLDSFSSRLSDLHGGIKSSSADFRYPLNSPERTGHYAMLRTVRNGSEYLGSLGGVVA